MKYKVFTHTIGNINTKMRKTAKNILTILGCLVANLAFSQNYIPYYPAGWEFKNDVDLIYFSQVKSVESEEFIIDNNEQFLYTTTSWNWNSTYQLTYYSITNHQFKDGSLDIQINYANPNGNQVKSVKILNPNTRTCPVFRSQREMEIVKAIYRLVPVILPDAGSSPPFASS